MIVIDASVLVDFLLGTPDAPLLRTQVFQPEAFLHAPHIIDVEVAQALRRNVLRQQAEPVRCQAALRDLAHLPLLRYPHYPLLPRIWALRQNLSAYDATYVALAESLGASLVTRDRRLANASGHRATIDLV